MCGSRLSTEKIKGNVEILRIGVGLVRRKLVVVLKISVVDCRR